MRYEIISGMLDIDAKGDQGGSTMWTEVREASKYIEGNGFVSKIVDVITAEKNDAGEIVRKTRYFKTSQPTPVVIVRYEYKSVDLYAKKFDLESLLQPYRDSNKALDDASSEEQKLARAKQQQQRVENVSIDPAVDAIATTIVDANPKIVAQVIGGKEKALNSLVGMVIGEIRKQQLSNVGDAFSISIALKQKIDERAKQ